MFNNLKIYINKIIKPFGALKLFIKADPYSNWILLVSLFILINVFFLTGSILKFYRIGSDDALLSDSSSQVEISTINRALLDKTLSVFEIKSENYDDLKKNRPIFPDPSI